MNRILSKALSAALPLAFCCGIAQADEVADEYHGYFRTGAGSSTAGGSQSCFGLGGNTMRYRLGNECDTYLELQYTKEMMKVEGVSFVGHVMTNGYSPNSIGDLKLELAKLYVEAKGIPELNGGTAWIGKRYYVRPDIHMLDLQYINLNGTGAGIDGIKAGPGRFSYALFKDNDTNVTDPVTGRVVNSNAAMRHNLVYQGLPTNQHGSLDAVVSLIKAEGTSGVHNGWQASLFHNQEKVFGGTNTVGIQYGVGPGTGIGGQCCNRIGRSGFTSQGSDVTRLRVFDSLWIQPTPKFGAQFVALVQRDKSDAAGGATTWTTVGVRPVYAISQHIKLQAELGIDRVKEPTGPAKRLTKITLAPTIAAGPGVWSRPELRAFVTYGKWNDAATASVNASNEGGPVYGNRTSATSYGFQVETWF
ncbi:MAG TPA: carbohydrate porin [Paucimonas sp.]|nr:carbohydrate porin [Paucimonas sp.]